MAGTLPRYALQELKDAPIVKWRIEPAAGLALTALAVPVSYIDDTQQYGVGDLEMRFAVGHFGGHEELTATPMERIFTRDQAALLQALQQAALDDWNECHPDDGSRNPILITQWADGRPTIEVVADFGEYICDLAGNFFDSRMWSGGCLWSIPRNKPEFGHLHVTGRALVTPSTLDGSGVHWLHNSRRERNVSFPIIVRWDSSTYFDDAKIHTSIVTPYGTEAAFQGMSDLLFAAELKHRIHCDRPYPKILYR